MFLDILQLLFDLLLPLLFGGRQLVFDLLHLLSLLDLQGLLDLVQVLVLDAKVHV